MIGRRAALAMGTLAIAAIARGASAQGWPSRPIRIIVPFGLGGSADVAGRFLAEQLAQSLGQPVVIENRPGAGGTIGADAVARATPDGYTLLLMSNTHTANETLLPNRPYVLMRDLAPVAFINVAHHVLAVHPSLPANSLQELIAYAKANPGKIDYASSGPGTPYHIAGEVFRARAGIEITHIPFRGSNEARTALIAGQVPMMFDAIPTMAEQARAGSVRALATTGPQRSPLLPDVPAIAETYPGFEIDTWWGLIAPAGTPRDVVARLNAAYVAALESPDVKTRFAGMMAEPVPTTPEQFGDLMRREHARYESVVKASGATVD